MSRIQSSQSTTSSLANTSCDETSTTSNLSKQDDHYASDTFEEDVDDNDSIEDSVTQCSNISKSSESCLKKTFTSSQIKKIERENEILMNKILIYERKPSKPKITISYRLQQSSAAINRKKNQRRIDFENQVSCSLYCTYEYLYILFNLAIPLILDMTDFQT